jgi:hypothetical protein
MTTRKAIIALASIILAEFLLACIYTWAEEDLDP